jgi:hypothetical protein
LEPWLAWELTELFTCQLSKTADLLIFFLFFVSPIESPFLSQDHTFLLAIIMAESPTIASAPRERRPSVSAPITDFTTAVGPPGMSRPKHKRTATGFGPSEIKAIEASVPEGQRAA